MLSYRSKDQTQGDAEKEDTENKDKEEKQEADEDEEELAQRPTDYMSGALGLIPS